MGFIVIVLKDRLVVINSEVWFWELAASKPRDPNSRVRFVAQALRPFHMAEAPLEIGRPSGAKSN